MRRLFQFGLTVLLFAVIALVSAVLTMQFAIHGAEVTVPDLRGIPEAEAMRRASALDLNITAGQHAFSAAVPAGHILAQSPAGGTRVRRGWRVRILDSLGAQKTPIPQLTGEQERFAALDVRRAGLALGPVAHMPYAAQPPDTVLAQSPSPGAANAEQPDVHLLLSAPVSPEASAYVMPDLRNQPIGAATAAIALAGLKLQPLEYRDAEIPPVSAIDASMQPAAPLPPATRGTVLAQVPEPGSRVDASSAIVLTVSR